MIKKRIIFLIVLFNRKNYKFGNYLALANNDKDKTYTEYYLEKTTRGYTVFYKYSRKKDYYDVFIKGGTIL